MISCAPSGSVPARALTPERGRSRAARAGPRDEARSEPRPRRSGVEDHQARALLARWAWWHAPSLTRSRGRGCELPGDPGGQGFGRGDDRRERGRRDGRRARRRRRRHRRQRPRLAAVRVSGTRGALGVGAAPVLRRAAGVMPQRAHGLAVVHAAPGAHEGAQDGERQDEAREGDDRSPDLAPPLRKPRPAHDPGSYRRPAAASPASRAAPPVQRERTRTQAHVICPGWTVIVVVPSEGPPPAIAALTVWVPTGTLIAPPRPNASVSVARGSGTPSFM